MDTYAASGRNARIGQAITGAIGLSDGAMREASWRPGGNLRVSIFTAISRDRAERLPSRPASPQGGGSLVAMCSRLATIHHAQVKLSVNKPCTRNGDLMIRSQRQRKRRLLHMPSSDVTELCGSAKATDNRITEEEGANSRGGFRPNSLTTRCTQVLAISRDGLSAESTFTTLLRSEHYSESRRFPQIRRLARRITRHFCSDT